MAAIWMAAGVIAACGPAPAAETPETDVPDFDAVFADGNRILFLGDSITQDGKYIAFIHAYLLRKFPERAIELINLGLSSETASGLTEPDHPFPRPRAHDRAEAALEVAEPDWTFICYGMNDGIYFPLSDERFQAYQDGIISLVETVAAVGSDVMILTPPPFDAASSKAALQAAGNDRYGYNIPYEGYDDVLITYGEWLESLDHRDDVAGVIDLHGPLVEFVSRQRALDPDYSYGDGVHPGADGHFVMAQTILSALSAPDIEETLVSADSPPASEREKDAGEGRFIDSVMQIHRLRSDAFRNYVGFSQQKDQSPRGNREGLDAALSKAAAAEEALRRRARSEAPPR